MSGTPFPSVALVDFTGKLDPSALRATAIALQIQAVRDLAPAPPLGYGIMALVRAATRESLHASDWVMGFFTDPDQPGALGYHDETPHGLPLAKIFPFLDPTQEASVTASHELAEMLVDPNICKAAQSPLDGKFWAYEVADPVEQDTYTIDGVKVSNFVLPPYFEPPTAWKGLKLDYLGLVSHPGEIRPGGYSQWFDPASGWQQVVADRRSGYREAVPGRSARRRARVGGPGVLAPASVTP